MKSHKITGGGGTQLHLVETGNLSGRPIMFIHGYSQCWLTWSRQMNSDLADDYRLIAMDIGGHGLSDKPREGYAQSKLWADDVIRHKPGHIAASDSSRTSYKPACFCGAVTEEAKSPNGPLCRESLPYPNVITQRSQSGNAILSIFSDTGVK